MMVKLTLIQQIIDFSNGSQIIAITGCLIIHPLVLGREVSPEVAEMKQSGNLWEGGGLLSVVADSLRILAVN